MTAPLSLNVVFDIVRSAASTVGGTKVSCRAGEVRIKCPTVFGPGGERWRAFVDRLWRLPEVEAVEIDRRHGTARVRFAKKLSGDRRLLERMSTALSADAAPTAGSPIAGLEEHLAGRRWIRLYRRGAGFSTWELVHELPGRIRVRDVGLRGRTDLVRQLELDLHTLPGVHTVTASATSGSMLVRFDPLAIDRDSLLAALDDTVRFSDLCALARTAPARAGFTLANTTLALATIGEFMFPAVLPASAILLVATNLAVFRGALGDIRERRVGLPLLHTSIVVGTLATGGFIASSLMSWLLLFWQNRHARRVATARQILGATVRKQHRTAWVCRDGVELETPANRLEPGHVISVRSGELLPVDGKVVSGTALVDEAIVRGTAGLVCRTARQSILRGTLVVEGELCVEVTRCGGDTVAERIGQSLDAATKDTSLSLKHVPPPMAHRAVPPALLTAGVGLMVGDAATAVAIMRPDYATGPEIGGSLLLVHQLGTCLQAGLVVRRAGVFAEMAAVDMVLIDQHLALERRESEVAGVVAPGSLAGSELLRFAECALRGICDPRSFALTAACAARQLTRLDLQAHCRAGHVEIVDRGRFIRIEGLAWPTHAESRAVERPVNGSAHVNGHGSNGHESQVLADTAPAPIEIFCDGRPAGTIVFRQGDLPAARQSLIELRTEHRLQVGVLTRDAAGAELAGSLELDFHQVCPTDQAQADYIAQRRRAGHRVAWVGDCRANPLAAAAADVAIAPVTDPCDDGDPAGVWLLEADYGRIAVLCAIARASRKRAQMHHGMTLIPNLTCVAGAFLFGFTSLAAVIISNFGTYTVYKRSIDELHQTERRLLARRIPHRRHRLLDAAHVHQTAERRNLQDQIHV